MNDNEQTNLVSPVSFIPKEEADRNSNNYEKEYMLFLVLKDENGAEFKDFVRILGRKEAYEYIKKYIQDEVLDALESKILLYGGVLGEDEINMAKFMFRMKESYFIDDEFDIEDYFELEDIMNQDNDIFHRE